MTDQTATSYQGSYYARVNGASAPADWTDLLATRLFTPTERWGWQFVNYAVPPPVEQAVGLAPVWRAPLPPVTSGPLQAAVALAARQIVWRAVVSGVLLFLAIAGSTDVWGAFFWLPAMIAGIMLMRAILRHSRAKAALEAFLGPFNQFRTAEEARFLQHQARWQAAAARHHAAIQSALYTQATAPVWFPVQPTAASARRLDVFGGDGRRDGWAALLATMGMSLLACGRSVGVLDLTGRDVAGGLARLAAARRVPTHGVDVSGRVGAVDWFEGISADDVADLVARAVCGVERSGEPDSHRRRRYAFLAGVLRAVVHALVEDGARSLSFADLTAAVQVLRRVYREGPLTGGQVGRLSALIDDFAGHPDAGGELFFLAEQIGSLASEAEVERMPLWRADNTGLLAHAGLRVITTSPEDRRERKEMLDLLLVLSAQRAVTRGGGSGFVNALVVAGADALGREVLEQLSAQCQRSGVRLVLMMERVQENFGTLIGAGSTVLLMQLGNHKDAEEAAAFIGHEHKLVVNQLTREVGMSFSDGGQDSFGVQSQEGTGVTTGPFPQGTSHSVNDSRSSSWQLARTWGVTDSIGRSVSQGRVYELTVEPRLIQTLPPTAFVLVDNAAGARRVVTGDCNPGLVLRDRVSATPLATR